VLRRKGLVLTLDAVFALIAATTIITATLYYTGELSKVPYNKQALSKMSQDSLTILEKDGILVDAIETGSSTTLAEFLNSTPNQVCARIDLKLINTSLIENATKTNCNLSAEPVISRRSFIANNFTVYYARMESWYVE